MCYCDNWCGNQDGCWPRGHGICSMNILNRGIAHVLSETWTLSRYSECYTTSNLWDAYLSIGVSTWCVGSAVYCVWDNLWKANLWITENYCSCWKMSFQRNRQIEALVCGWFQWHRFQASNMVSSNMEWEVCTIGLCKSGKIGSGMQLGSYPQRRSLGRWCVQSLHLPAEDHSLPCRALVTPKTQFKNWQSRLFCLDYRMLGWPRILPQVTCCPQSILLTLHASPANT